VRDGHNSLTPAEQQSHTSTIKIPNSEDGKLLEKRFAEERRTQGMKRQEFQGSIIYTNSSCSTHGPSKAVPSNETVEEIQAKAINAYLDWKHRKREMDASS